MNVLIKEMDVPQNCFDCPLGLIFYERSHKWKHEKRTYACALSGKMMTSTKRNRFCPLIELPDHGDLIDRDELMMKMWGADAYASNQRSCNVRVVFVRDIEAAPVVIPAERSEDDQKAD